MNKIKDKIEPFRFFTRLHLSQLTGLKARNLSELLKLIKEVPGSSIYHHTHRFLQQHQYLSPEPPNDFAYWVHEILGEEILGERLASIDIIQYPTIRAVRDKIAAALEEYLVKYPHAKRKFAHDGDEFHFIRSTSFVLPTKYSAVNLAEFADILDHVTLDSIYFHIFEARLRLEKGNNDFSNWIGTSLGDKELAQKISKLDPYTYTIEDLRKTLIKIIKKRIQT